MRSAGSIYAQLLGPAFGRLPRLVQRVHGAEGVRRVAGRCDIDRGDHPFAQWIADIFGMPHAGREVPVAVTFRVDGRREIWQRDFAGEPVVTTHELGRGWRAGLIIERFWPFEFALRIPVRTRGLALEVAGPACSGSRCPTGSIRDWWRTSRPTAAGSGSTSGSACPWSAYWFTTVAG